LSNHTQLKKLLGIITFIFCISSLKAQSAEETLEWINIKKIDISSYDCFSRSIKNRNAKKTFEFTTAYFKATDESGGFALGLWKEIKEVKKKNNVELEIVFVYDETKQDYLSIRLQDEALRDKYYRAFKHMATLKGAKMIDSDLF